METWSANASNLLGGNPKGDKRRSETVSVRLDPKLRYLAELAARKQRRTLSSFIEWAIEESLANIPLTDRAGNVNNIRGVAADLWDVEEPDRFIRVATQYPDLLVHNEQRLWKVISEYGGVWRGYYDNDGEWTWGLQAHNAIYPRVREYWLLLNKVAFGDSHKSDLPRWSPPKSGDMPNIMMDEDDVPF
jgi:hypothetical protein